MPIRLLTLLLVISFLAACSSKPSRYRMADDADPGGHFDVSGVPLVEPKWEPMSPGGNKSPYSVDGETYRILPTASGYQEEGYASWYGLKFHGELTSNGEIYNMYEFSAAHKSLPLPSYLRVTNLENGKKLVVRVNDRGPFHSDRIIDLSYAAAIKLGFKDKGTARVRLEAITPSRDVSPKASGQNQVVAKKVEPEPAVDRLAPFIQVAAYSNYDFAEAMLIRIEKILGTGSGFVVQAKNTTKPLYRVRLGPYENELEAGKHVEALKAARIGSPQIITRSVRAPDS